MDDLLRGGRFIKATIPYFSRRDVGWVGRAQWNQSGDRMSLRRTGTGCSSYGQMECRGPSGGRRDRAFLEVGLILQQEIWLLGVIHRIANIH
jgi:hypothetical protein